MAKDTHQKLKIVNYQVSAKNMRLKTISYTPLYGMKCCFEHNTDCDFMLLVPEYEVLKIMQAEYHEHLTVYLGCANFVKSNKCDSLEIETERKV